MRVSWGSDNGRHLTITCEEPGRWEAQPRVPEFRVHHYPVGEHADRLAVAATLLFGDAFNGMVHFPKDINLVTASAIRDFCYPGEVFVAKIDEGPKSILSGTGDLYLSRNIGDAVTQIPKFINRRLIDLPSSTYNGAVGAHRLSVIASNSHHFDRGNMPNGLLAVGVLMSVSLDANVLIARPQPDRDYQRRVSALLGSVGLGVRFEDEDG